MTTFLYANNAATILAGAISATATTVNVAAGTGAKFPSPGAGQAFSLTFVDAATGLINEIAYCTARSTDQMTIERGQEGTQAAAWNAGDVAANFLTALAIQGFQVGFTPVQQGGGADQEGNKIYLGWDGSGLRLQVDGNDQGDLATAASVTTEKSRATAAEGALYNEITSEITRAENAEGTLNSGLQSEVHRAENAEALLAPLQSPAFGGDPHAPTPAAGDASPSIANTLWVSDYYLALTGGTIAGPLVVQGGFTVEGGASINLEGSGQVNSTGSISQNGPAGTGWSGNLTTGTNPIHSQQTGVYLAGAVYSFNGATAAGYFGTGAAGANILQFVNSKGSTIGAVMNSGDSSVAYAQTCDYRLKANVETLDGARSLARLAATRPVSHTFANDPAAVPTTSFIAHELAERYPEAVFGEKDAVREVEGADPVILPQMADLTRMIPDLVAAVAHLGAELAAAQAQIADLKAARTA